MEADGQRLYSVLTRTEVREKMMKEIEQISEVFSLSKSDATVILIRLRWNSFQASDRLGDNKETFLAELGLVQVFDLNQNESVSRFADHKTTHSDGGDGLVSTPFCSHKFCTTCWGDYLNKTLEKKKENNNNEKEEEEIVVVLCPNPDCVASVGPDTIEKLTEPVKMMYESYVLESYMVNNKESMKWCPAPGCDYAIERHEDVEDDESIDFGVVCVCGHVSCWCCQLESHRPVTCENASNWLTSVLNIAKSCVWIAKYTKRCPSCNSCVFKNGDPDLRLVTCLCSRSFCWICFRSEEEHNGKWNCVAVSVPPEDAFSSNSYSYALTHHLSLWEASHEALVKANSDLKAIEEDSIRKLTEDCGLGEEDVRALREAWMLVVQCRQVLKWFSAFSYFITEYQSTKKQYLDHLGEQATTILLKHQETLHELMNGAISAGDITCFKHKLETSTRNTGNYFHYFVRTLEDGLPEVKLDAYEDASTSYWFCDRCTFKNSLADNECKICFVPLDALPPHPHVDFGNHNNTPSAHDEQVPNMTNNLFDGEEFINPWKFD